MNLPTLQTIWILILFGSLNFPLSAQIFTASEPVLIETGFQFTEGPAWLPDNYLLFSDVNGNAVLKWNEETGIETFASNAGNPNGIACSRKNEIFVCRHGARDIGKIDQNGIITSLYSNFQSKKFNSPNDIELSYRGSVFFTDPDFGLNTASRELSYEGLFCIPYNKNEIILLDSTLAKPNGLTFVDDWRTLYVCETSTNKIYSYYLRDEYLLQDITKDKKVFLSLPDSGEVDGLCADIFGNLYVAFGDGGIKVFDRQANEIGHIEFPSKEKVRNLCFGGKYKNILFVTAGKSLYKVNINFFGDFIAPGMLGVPTDRSVVFNALSDKALTAFIAYGTNYNDLQMNTDVMVTDAGNPLELVIDGLNANSQYFYQLKYKLSGQSEFKSGTSGSFHTQRSPGSEFSFAVEADAHLDESSNYQTFRNTLNNIQNLSPDFLIDLGDNFLTEKFPIIGEYYLEQRCLLYRNFWDKICHSIPLFLVQGNHDAELGWLNENRAEDIFNLSNTIRKKYYPMPQPDFFYSGNDLDIPYFGHRENYFTWTWGDALFVVIDPYAFTLEKTSDPWCFTLGKAQYDWFKATLENSTAKFKFVFAHQLLGGMNAQGRGGMEMAHLYEQGGYNSDGSYGFDEKRPGWGKSLHQIMVESGVQIYFHGHDHFYAQQEKDGIIYQEVPQPTFPGYTVANDAENYGYLSGLILPNSGHLHVTILGDSARVDYIGGYHIDNPAKNQINGESRATYFIKSNKYGVSDLDNPDKQAAPVRVYQSDHKVIMESQTRAFVRIQIYNLSGQLLSNLWNGEMHQGELSIPLPHHLLPGIYLLTIQADEHFQTMKVVIHE